ncbi:hypothetical protein SAMN06296036_123112 [Pseudobacteriovorax antillogorgiicola]|uniref:Uncharacterized protein n=1 Tax=Pseudobacteriovorax antillogorgiicola TaxID=1513793 RepID=A0A1Y6CNX9_9BACT|nr:hypothetical protein EDD56_123112 [Pseudobacteriovorax antillogorgiicola]SMF67283.1 hypothetical protein SAMN06296036_123112 [Pseudobacteriovorax antillogorgiicola]
MKDHLSAIFFLEACLISFTNLNLALIHKHIFSFISHLFRGV